MFFVHPRFPTQQINLSLLGLNWHYFYLGYIPIIFSTLAFLIDWRKTRSLFILLIIFSLLSFGAHTRLDLFKVLWQLPFFHSIEAPERYFIHLLIFIIALLSGRFFLIRQKLKGRLVNLIFISVIIFTIVDLFFTNGGNGKSFYVPLPKYTKQVPFFLN